MGAMPIEQGALSLLSVFVVGAAAPGVS